MADVFVSYPRTAAQQAGRMTEALRALGYSVWVDEELPAHRNFSRVIEEQLDEAKAVLVIWSADAAESDWVRDEAEHGRQQRKLVQVSVDNTRLPMPFGQIQCAELVGWSGDLSAPGWRKALDSIAALVGRKALVAGHGGRSHPLPALPMSPILAVLAFDNASADPEMGYFSDGVSEEILQLAARSANLRVIGQASSFQFRGPDKAADRVGAALGATHVLDGSVRRAGAKVRIFASLVECAAQTIVWSNRFDRDLTDIFALQDEIAEAVAQALQVALVLPSAQAVDPEIYDLYLQARALLTAGTPDWEERHVRVIAMFERVVAAAPHLAGVWADLALARAEALRFFDLARFPGLTRASVMDAADRAIKADPSRGSAYLALSLLKPWGLYAEREALHRQALSVAPNDLDVLTSMADFCMAVGRSREALVHARRASELDPLSAAATYTCLSIRDSLGLWEETEAEWDSACARWPDHIPIANGAINNASRTKSEGEFEARAEWYRQRGVYSDNVRIPVERVRNMRRPSPAYAERVLALAHTDLETNGAPTLGQLGALCELGMGEDAFALIDRASFVHMFDEAGRPPGGLFSPADIFQPSRELLRRDPRFLRLCAKLGLCDYWIATNRWPDCADQVPYDFRDVAFAAARGRSETTGDGG